MSANTPLDRWLVPVTALAEQGPRQGLRIGQLNRYTVRQQEPSITFVGRNP